MAILSNMLSPLSVAFIVIIFGCLIGKIKFVKISFDLSAVLVVAVLVGWMLSAVTSCSAIISLNEYETNMKFLASFGTALFVSSIGISTGSVLDFQNRRDMKAIALGSLMVCSAFVVMKIISLLDNNISESNLMGVLCGALTTTPGLSTACELSNISAEEAMVGYGSTYLFGVIATVLFVQIVTRKKNIIQFQNEPSNPEGKKIGNLSIMILVSSAIALGVLLGSIKIFDFSLGNSGGVLCAGIIIGLLVHKIFNESIPTLVLTQFKNMGLALFFVGNGILTGMELNNGFDLKNLLYGAILTIVPIVSGCLLNNLIIGDECPATMIAGGMTSTPAIGLIVDKNPQISLSKYSLAYFGALITIVVLIRIGI